jgi:outer membrane protein OmpA-like peptidoglycan-associated protein
MLFVLALVGAAQAQAPVPQLNTQVFRPAIGSTSGLWTEDTHVEPDGYAHARAFVQYAHRPFRLRVGDDTQVVVQDVAELDLAGAYTFRGLRLGAHVPVYGWTSSPLTRDQAGLGDLMLDLQGRVVDGAAAPVGVALAGRLILPTASVAAPLGNRSTGWELAAIVDRRFGDLHLSTNVGTRGVPRAVFEHIVWDDQLFVRTGAGYHLTPSAGLSAELGAQTNWSSGDNPAGTAAELMGGGWYGIAESVTLRGGASVGLGRAPGTPVARLLLGASWEPDRYPDRDLDGIVDRDDWCPDEPEDEDGFDDWDGCVDAPTTIVLDVTDPDGAPIDGLVVRLQGPEDHELTGGDKVLTLHPGTYTVHASADGYLPLTEELVVGEQAGQTLQRPLVAKLGTLRLWTVDTDGNPVEGYYTVSGGDPWPADGREVTVPAGEHALVIAAEGYTAQAVSLHVEHGQGREYSAVLVGEGASRPVRMTSDRIEIDEQVFFALNKATIQPASYGLLDAVASTILAHPEVSRVRIEGHTDDQGPASYNTKLSQQRADAVRAYLVSKGVDPTRLRSVGFGSSRPLKPGDDESAHEANRRVEFHLES